MCERRLCAERAGASERMVPWNRIDSVYPIAMGVEDIEPVSPSLSVTVRVIA